MAFVCLCQLFRLTFALLALLALLAPETLPSISRLTTRPMTALKGKMWVFGAGRGAVASVLGFGVT
jgi:hypothetical protein